MKKNLLFLLFSVILFSCQKESKLSPIPSIEFKSFYTYNIDSADCVISFKDGDGDIGVINTDSSNKSNLKLLYLYKNSNGDFVPFDATYGTTKFDTLYYEYQVPNLTPSGQFKSLQGDIKIKLRSAPVFGPMHSTVKFDITLWDRAGNKSNTVSTNEIAVPR